MAKIAHLSDLHLTGNSGRDDKIMSRIRGRLSSIIETSGTPDFLVVSGDIIDGPRWTKKNHTQFLRGCLERLRSLCTLLSDGAAPSRLRIAPGNHDLKAVGMIKRGFTLTEFTNVFKDHLGFYADPAKKIVFASFNTNFTTPAIETATGTASAAEIGMFNTWMNSQSLAVQRYPRVAVLHHHPMPVAESEGQPNSLIDPTDYLRLRNAGTLLKRLIEAGFHLTLHGHLHAPEHWSVSSAFSVSSSSTMRPLEVIGAGSAGKLGNDDKYSLNMVTVYELGWIHASKYDFADHGGIHQPVDLVRRGFEFVRPSIGSTANEQPELPFRCKATHIDVRVAPRTGLVESDTKHFGLRSRTEEQRQEFPIFTRFDSVTNRPSIVARALDSKIPLPVAHQDQAIENGFSKFTHAIDVRGIGELTNPRDVAYLIKTSGAVFGTRQHADWFSGGTSRTFESFSYKVRFKQDLLCVAISFVDLAPEITPSTFRLEVRDADGLPVHSESSSAEVCLAVHQPWKQSDSERLRSRHFGPDVSLNVHKPITGFTYDVQWDLPQRFDQDHEPASRLRGVLFKPSPSGRKDIKPVVELFLSNVIKQLRDMAFQHTGTHDENCDAYLYGIDSGTGRSQVTCNIEGIGAKPLPSDIAWGKSLVGECVRYRRGVVWGRPLVGVADSGDSMAGPMPGREIGVPPNTLAICVLPLWPSNPPFKLSPTAVGAEPIKYLPVCAIAIGAYSTESALFQFLKASKENLSKFGHAATQLLDDLQESINQLLR